MHTKPRNGGRREGETARSLRYVAMMASSCDPVQSAVGGHVKTESDTLAKVSGRTNWTARLLNAVAEDAHGGSGRDVSSGAVSAASREQITNAWADVSARFAASTRTRGGVAGAEALTEARDARILGVELVGRQAATRDRRTGARRRIGRKRQLEQVRGDA